MKWMVGVAESREYDRSCYLVNVSHDGERTARRTRVDGERTRKLILETAVRLATIEGLDGLSIGKLASAIEVSKSGVYAHFDSKEDLQLATVDTARELFIAEVVVPALEVEGLERMRALCESFLTYVEQRVLPGGCFFAAAAAELGGRAGPLKERVATNQRDWIRVLTSAANQAVQKGQLDADTDIAVLVFELNALVVAANTAFILHDDPELIARARTAVDRVLSAATPD